MGAMHEMKRVSKIGWAIALAVCSGLGAVSANAELTLEVTEKAPPAELAADVSAQLIPKCHLISDSEGPLFEFWFVKEIPVKKLGDTVKKSLENIEEASIIGAVVVKNDEMYDFRDDPMDPGIFVMRMALQPQDGNHMGTAPFDTFAILIPYEKDGQLFENGPPDHDFLVEIASEDTVAEHPPILSIQPYDKAEGDFPRLDEADDEEWLFLNLQLPVKVGGESKTLAIHLVYEGIGEL